MAEELRTAKTRAIDFNAQSSRSSIDSTRIQSPASRSRQPSLAPTGDGSKRDIDYVYLKNVLLQFLEQKDKKHQMQLVPVLGMLLHFDRSDEQKWMSAITAK